MVTGIFLERVVGIEPTSSAWKAVIIAIILHALVPKELVDIRNIFFGVKFFL